MTDDIFAYFSGNSPRKVEPLDPNEMFDDLRSVDAEVEPVETAEVCDDFAQDSSAAPRAETECDARAEVTSEKPSGKKAPSQMSRPKTKRASGSSWDLLASELGLAPEPVVSESDFVAEPEAAFDEPEENDFDEPEVVSETFDELSEVSEDVESDRDLEPSMEWDQPEPEFDEDDPFAAFSGATGRSHEVLEEIIDIEIVDDVELDSDSDPQLDADDPEGDADFVEFEVTELTTRGGSKRSRFGRRDEGERTERRPRRDDSRRKPERETSDERSGDARDEQEEISSDESAEKSGRRRRRGRRRREPGETADATVADQGRDDQREIREPERKRPRNRPEPAADSGIDEIEMENDDDQSSRSRSGKKTKIPTWDDAITDVIEGNIKRHSKPPRGQRRRR